MGRVYILLIPIIVLLSFVLSSCGTSDNVVSSWPIQKRKYNKGWYIPMFAKKPKPFEHKQDISAFKGPASTETTEKVREQVQRVFAFVQAADKALDLSLLFHPQDSLSNNCDLILFRTGEEMQVKIIEVGVTDVKYKKCNRLDGPVYSRPKAEVIMITYPDGQRDIMPVPVLQTLKAHTTPIRKRQEPLGLAGFMLSFIGTVLVIASSTSIAATTALPLFIGGIGLGLIGWMLGIAGLSRILASPERYNGGGWGVVAISLGSWALIFIVLYLVAQILDFNN